MLVLIFVLSIFSNTPTINANRFGIKNDILIETLERDVYRLNNLKQSNNNSIQIVSTPAPSINITGTTNITTPNILNISSSNVGGLAIPEYAIALITLASLCILTGAYPTYLKVKEHIKLKRQIKIDNEKKEEEIKKNNEHNKKVVENAKDGEILVFNV